jgi:hypothetical protein
VAAETCDCNTANSVSDVISIECEKNKSAYSILWFESSSKEFRGVNPKK